MYPIVRRILAMPLLLLAGCAVLPTGPAVMVLPGSQKSFEQFRADDYRCRDYAYFQIGGQSPNKAAVASGVGSAVVGGALGAAAGAAIGGGSGAAVGAGTGAALGGVAGTGSAIDSAHSSQDRYDINYIQCMYANGHKVPVYGNFTSLPSRPRLAPPGATPPPPPPPGAPPSPPTR